MKADSKCTTLCTLSAIISSPSIASIRSEYRCFDGPPAIKQDLFTHPFKRQVVYRYVLFHYTAGFRGAGVWGEGGGVLLAVVVCRNGSFAVLLHKLCDLFPPFVFVRALSL